MRLFGKRHYVVLAFALLVLFWGSAFSVVKVGLGYSPPMIYAGLRTLVGGFAILLVAVVWVLNKEIIAEDHKRVEPSS